MGQRAAIVEREASFTAADGVVVPAFIAEPQAAPGAPRLLIAPEYFGLTPWVREVARRLAREGFRAVAVEIFARDPLPPGANPQALMARAGRLSWPGAVADLRAGFRLLEGPGKAGSIGFCMGGSLSLLLAAGGGLDAAVSCYGRVKYAGELNALRPEHPLTAAARIPCPVLGIYGKEDAGIPLADVAALEAALPTGSVVALYEAGHAFLNDTRPEMYVGPQATLAWAKIVGFLHRRLA